MLYRLLENNKFNFEIKKAEISLSKCSLVVHNQLFEKKGLGRFSSSFFYINWINFEFFRNSQIYIVIMGILNFTNCTLFVFFVHISFTGKSFYDIFFPADCKYLNTKSSDCIYSIPNWQQEFTVSFPFTA